MRDYINADTYATMRLARDERSAVCRSGFDTRSDDSKGGPTETRCSKELTSGRMLAKASGSGDGRMETDTAVRAGRNPSSSAGALSSSYRRSASCTEHELIIYHAKCDALVQ